MSKSHCQSQNPGIIRNGHGHVFTYRCSVSMSKVCKEKSILNVDPVMKSQLTPELVVLDTDVPGDHGLATVDILVRSDVQESLMVFP